MTQWRDKQGRFKACCVQSFNYDDPMNAECGCLGEIINMLRKKDLAAGCPTCRAEVMENASEPDVLRRWELV